MSGICVCHNHNEMMGQPLCFSFCCLFVRTRESVCVCVCSITQQSAFYASVASELAYLPCLCVGIVSGLSGHCIPDMWYSQC